MAEIPTDLYQPTATTVDVLSFAKPAEKSDSKTVFVAYSYKTYPKEDYRKVYKELESRPSFAVQTSPSSTSRAGTRTSRLNSGSRCR